MNKVSKNAEKGIAGIIIAGIATICAEIAEEIGVPVEAKPWIITVVAGGLMAATNYIKHKWGY